VDGRSSDFLDCGKREERQVAPALRLRDWHQLECLCGTELSGISPITAKPAKPSAPTAAIGEVGFN